MLTLASLATAHGEGAYFVTYSDQMEEPRNLELSLKGMTGKPGPERRFAALNAEFEYGVTGWWTTELYLDGQSTRRDSSVFTGYRWENRFRLLNREHWINPVLYVEFENINGADKSLLEVVGFDGEDALLPPNAEARMEKKRELEAKLLLSSNWKGWNFSENFIAEKNIVHAPFEFGYSLGISRPLALAARPETCSFCPENLRSGIEIYGGLGTHEHFGVLQGTSHYVAPVVSWRLNNGTVFSVSPAFGVTAGSSPLLIRFGVSYEIAQFGRGPRSQSR